MNKNSTITLYELLEEYKKQFPEPKRFEECNTKQELVEEMILHDLLKAIELIRNCLIYDM